MPIVNDISQPLANTAVQKAGDLASGFFRWSDNLGTASFGQSFDNLITGNLDYSRDYALQKDNQAFNALEAEKAYQRNIDMTKNQYKYIVEGMKEAGLNPALLYGSGGVASAYSGAQAARSSGSGRSSSSGGLAQLLSAVGRIAMTAFGMANQNHQLADKLATQLNIANARNSNALDVAELRNNGAFDAAKVRGEYAVQVAELRNAGIMDIERFRLSNGHVAYRVTKKEKDGKTVKKTYTSEQLNSLFDNLD